MVTNYEEVIPKNDAELIEMERRMRSAPEPGALPTGSLGSVGGDSVPVHDAHIVSAGHVIMWNTDTRESSVFNLNAVRTKLREVFPRDYENVPMRGKHCWTAIEPSEPPWRGTSTCPLHVSRPERADFDQLGYPRCTYDVGANEMEAQRHLRKKHPSVFRMMNELTDAGEKKAEASSRGMLQQILAKLAGVDEPASEPLSVPLETKILDETTPLVETFTDSSATDITVEIAPEDVSASTTTAWAEMDAGDLSPAPKAVGPEAKKYFCGKCEKNHVVGSGIGWRHRKKKIG